MRIEGDEKGNKISIVVLSDAHPEPGTVMIVPLHAVVAYAAVDGADGSIYPAFDAELVDDGEAGGVREEVGVLVAGGGL